MKRFREMNTLLKLSALAGALAVAMGPASAADVYLAAKPFMKDLPVSGGTVQSVPMWGYVEDTDGVCFKRANKNRRLACINNRLGPPSLPGPRLTVDPADPVLTIYLSNGLPEPSSIVIPGQKLPVSVGTGPTWSDGLSGGRTTPGQKVRSYGREAAANGGRQSYTFTIERNGSFIYHSGTWPQKQVYMGLYGAVTKDAVAADVADGIPAEAYPGVPYDNEVVLFYSDVDPVLNNAIHDGTYTTSISYQAQWFLINGEPYVDGMADIAMGSTGDTTLLRFLSTASETHVPTLQGMHMTIHAEDGFRYNYQDGDTVEGFAPREQYTAMLPALKTKDATITVPAITPPATEGRYAVYDGNGYMTNPSDPNNFDIPDEIGGMLRFLSTGAGDAVGDVVLYLSLTNATGTLIGLGPNGSDLAYLDDDILSWNGQFYEKVLDGAAAGLSGDVYAFDIDEANDRILLVFNAPGVIGGLAVDDSDVLAYNRTTGAFSLFFDGSDVGLTTSGERLDAIDLLPSGDLVLSTRGAFSVAGGLAGQDEDLIVFRPTNLGANTSGSFRMGFDGSDVALNTNDGEDVDAATVANGDVYLSTVGNFSVTGLSGQSVDVFVCTPSSLGDNTACQFSLFFDGSEHGLTSENVDAIDLP